MKVQEDQEGCTILNCEIEKLHKQMKTGKTDETDEC